MLIAPAFAGELRPTQDANAPSRGSITIESKHVTEPEQVDWSVLNWDAHSLAVPPPPKRDWNGSAPPIIQPEWNRGSNGDGSSAVTVKRSLPIAFDSHVGIDMNMAARPEDDVRPVDPDKLTPGYTPGQSSGAAWASITAPVPVVWDKASFDARYDPLHEERKFGTHLSKSVPLGERFSVTVQNGYSVTQAPTAVASASEFYSAENSARLNVLPTGTAFSVGTTMSSLDDRWLSSVSAEQKLFDGVSITGTVSETIDGEPNKSLTAGFRRTW